MVKLRIEKLARIERNRRMLHQLIEDYGEKMHAAHGTHDTRQEMDLRNRMQVLIDIDGDLRHFKKIIESLEHLGTFFYEEKEDQKAVVGHGA